MLVYNLSLSEVKPVTVPLIPLFTTNPTAHSFAEPFSLKYTTDPFAFIFHVAFHLITCIADTSISLFPYLLHDVTQHVTRIYIQGVSF